MIVNECVITDLKVKFGKINLYIVGTGSMFIDVSFKQDPDCQHFLTSTIIDNYDGVVWFQDIDFESGRIWIETNDVNLEGENLDIEFFTQYLGSNNEVNFESKEFSVTVMIQQSSANTAPYFELSLPNLEFVAHNPFTYVIPDPVDDEGDGISMQVDVPAAFLEYDSKTKKLKVIEEGTTNDNAGMYVVKIKLKDDNDLQ